MKMEDIENEGMREKKLSFQVLVHQEEWQFKWMVLGELSGKD